MQFVCNKSRLTEALNLLTTLIPVRSTKTSLQNIKFSVVAQNTLQLEATDLDVGIKYLIEVEDLQSDNAIILPAIRLNNIIRDAWGDKVLFKCKDYRAQIKTAGAKFDLLGESADNFPPIPDINQENCVEILASDVISAIQKTSIARAKEEERYSLAGIYLNINENNIDFAATDNFRLALSKYKLSKSNIEEKKGIVLAKGMQELAKLANGEDLIKIQITDTEFFVKTSRATLVSRLIEGKFPQYEKFIPKDLNKKIIVEKSLFLQGLKQAANLCNEETKAVNITIYDEKMELRSVLASGGEAFVEIKIKAEGGETSIGFNSHYLIEALRVIEDEYITLKIRDNDTPICLYATNYIYMISPISAKKREDL